MVTRSDKLVIRPFAKLLMSRLTLLTTSTVDLVFKHLVEPSSHNCELTINVTQLCFMFDLGFAIC